MRRALFIIIVGLGGAAILIALGTWQVQRLAWKQDVIADIEARIGAAPVVLPDAPDAESDAYLPVKVSGKYAGRSIRVLVSQKLEGAGYRIISSFQTGDRYILIDRGFARADSDAATANTWAGPAVPEGRFEITGNLQWPNEIDNFTPEPDRFDHIWYARDLDAMAKDLLTEPILLVARTLSPPEPNVTPLPVDTTRIPNNHLQYAITWFSLAAIWLAMSLYFVRRRTPSAPASES